MSAKGEQTTWQAAGRSSDYGGANASLMGGTWFLAGQSAVDQEASAATGELEKQVRQTMARVARVLTECGRGLEDVVRITSYVSVADCEDELDAVLGTIFDEPYPAHSIVGVDFAVSGQLYEADVIASGL